MEKITSFTIDISSFSLAYTFHVRIRLEIR